MFDLSNIGAAAGGAGATASLHAEESADTASFRSFVEALRSLASVDDAENGQVSTWLATGPAALATGDSDAAGGEVAPVASNPDESAAVTGALPTAADVSLAQWSAWALAPGVDAGGESADDSPADVGAGAARTESTASRATHDLACRPAADLIQPRIGDEAGTAGDVFVAGDSTVDDTTLIDINGVASSGPGETLTNEADADDAAARSTSGEPAMREVVAAAVSAGADSGRDDHSRRPAHAHAEANAPAALTRRPQQLSGIPGGLTVAALVSSTQAHVWRAALAQADAGSLPPSDALPAATTAQIVQAMRLQWTRGVGEAHIRLDPTQYGDLTVSLRVDDGRVVARVQSDTPIVREWLQTHQGWLRQSLSDQGLTLSRLEVHEPSSESRDEREAGGRDSASRDADQPPARRPRRSPTDGVFEVVA